jgi:thiol-disulfide isomerase/thioredoxin
MDTMEHFSHVWCDACQKIQPMIFDVMQANRNNDHDAAGIVCAECKSIIATLHAARTRQAGARPGRAAKAREMAGQAVDRLTDLSATDEERQSRKRRLLKGPKEFREIRDKRRKPKH